jgi:hypothetical protein
MFSSEASLWDINDAAVALGVRFSYFAVPVFQVQVA